MLLEKRWDYFEVFLSEKIYSKKYYTRILSYLILSYDLHIYIYIYKLLSSWNKLELWIFKIDTLSKSLKELFKKTNCYLWAIIIITTVK